MGLMWVSRVFLRILSEFYLGVFSKARSLRKRKKVNQLRVTDSSLTNNPTSADYKLYAEEE